VGDKQFGVRKHDEQSSLVRACIFSAIKPRAPVMMKFDCWVQLSQRRFVQRKSVVSTVRPPSFSKTSSLFTHAQECQCRTGSWPRYYCHYIDYGVDWLAI